jgi:hypothetical protein
LKKTAAKLAVGAAAAGIAVVGIGSAAWAAPTNAKGALPVTAVCDNGHTYSLVVNGGGGGGNGNGNSSQSYNAAHFVTSNSVFVPVSFGESTFTQTDASGNVVFQQTQPAAAKGNGNATGPANATSLSCTYTFSQTVTDPTTGDVLFTNTGSGSVEGFLPGSQSSAA